MIRAPSLPGAMGSLWEVEFHVDSKKTVSLLAPPSAVSFPPRSVRVDFRDSAVAVKRL
jgi:hypothetical protein